VGREGKGGREGWARRAPAQEALGMIKVLLLALALLALGLPERLILLLDLETLG